MLGGGYVDWKLAKEEHHTRQKGRPQPSLSTPIGSIRCQRDTMDTSSLILGMRWDFLLYAASHGIHRYVHHILEIDNTVPSENAVVYLLHLSIFSGQASPSGGTGRVLSGLHLTQELLSRDVDLKLEVSSDSTVWSMLLVRMSSILLPWISGTAYRYSETQILELQIEFAKTMIAFIASGAVTTQIIILTLKQRVYTKDLTFYHYRFRLSVWAIAELCLKGQSELRRIREACNDASAPYYANCFSVQVLRGTPGMLFW